MKRWLRKIIWDLVSIPFQRSVDWTEHDKQALDLFCKSACGRKLLELLRQTVATTTFRAVYRDQVSANGIARGMQDLLAVIHRLRSFPPQAESYEDEDIEPLPSQRAPIDGRRFNLSGGHSAIGK